MIQFAHPEALYLFFGLLPLLGLFLLYLTGRKRAMGRFGERSLMDRLMPDRPLYKHWWKFSFLVVAYTGLTLALANPQVGLTYEKVKREGVDLMVAIDISKSMLAEDEKPNRLSRARLFVSRLIDELAGDRVGVILFAGNAYLQVPITSDYIAAKTFLKTVRTDLAPTQGTAIGDAIRLANDAFDHSETQFRTMLIISDGENHEGEALEAAKEAAEKGMVIHTVGIGSGKGAPIPATQGSSDYKRDGEGNIVFTKLNENMLRQVAAAGNGRYWRLSQGNAEVEAVMAELAGQEKQEFEEHTFTDYEDQFQWFVTLALLFLGLEFLLSERRSRWLTDWSIFQGEGRRIRRGGRF